MSKGVIDIPISGNLEKLNQALAYCRKHSDSQHNRAITSIENNEPPQWARSFRLTADRFNGYADAIEWAIRIIKGETKR
jgi:hypothetical protein